MLDRRDCSEYLSENFTDHIHAVRHARNGISQSIDKKAKNIIGIDFAF
jgi:hypothetical protein